MGKIKARIFTISDNLSEKFKIDLSYYIKNSFWVFIGQIITLVIGIALSVVFARFTTKEVFGQYNFLISILALISIVSIPGLNQSILRSVVQGYEGTYKKGVKLSFLWSLVGTPLLIFIGLWYFLIELNHILGICLLIVSIFFPFYYAPCLWNSFHMGKSDFKRINIYSSLNSLINFAVVGSTIFLTKGFIIYIFTSYLITNTILNVIYYFKSLKYIENDKEDEGWKKQGYNLTLNSFISLSYNHIDKLLIGLLLGNEQLAVYSIAVTVILSLKKFQKSLFDIIRNKIFSKEFRLKLVKRRVALLFVLSTTVTVFFILIIPYVIIFLYSDKYISSILFAQMYLVILPLSILLMIFGNVFIKIKKEKVAIQTEVISITLNLIAYFVLIPIIGIIGAILSSYVYYISRIILYLIFLHKYRRIV